MTAELEIDNLLIERIREGDQEAWAELILRYEGRLLAFTESRIGSRGMAEDVVQETFIGFLSSPPNFDGSRPLESYLFSICAYKLTDFLRREGRRPAIPFSVGTPEGDWQFVGSARPASTIARSVERRRLEEQAVQQALTEHIERWKAKGDWTKLQCLELLFVRGESNKQIAKELNLTEQQVANYKSDFLIRLRSHLKRMQLDSEVFPELQE